MLNTEKALDLLPLIGSIYEKLDVKEYMKSQAQKAVAKHEGLSREEMAKKIGLDVLLDTVFILVFKNAKSIKEEIFEIVSIVQEIDIEVVKKQGLIKSILALKTLLNDEDIKELFI